MFSVRALISLHVRVTFCACDSSTFRLVGESTPGAGEHSADIFANEQKRFRRDEDEPIFGSVLCMLVSYSSASQPFGAIYHDRLLEKFSLAQELSYRAILCIVFRFKYIGSFVANESWTPRYSDRRAFFDPTTPKHVSPADSHSIM